MTPATSTMPPTVLVIEEHSLSRANSSRFFEEAVGHLQPGAKIVLDLSSVRSIDDAGWMAISALQKRAAELDGDVSICSLHKPVRTLFQQLRLHKRVAAFNSPDEVLRLHRVG